MVKALQVVSYILVFILLFLYYVTYQYFEMLPKTSVKLLRSFPIGFHFVKVV